MRSGTSSEESMRIRISRSVTAQKAVTRVNGVAMACLKTWISTYRMLGNPRGSVADSERGAAFIRRTWHQVRLMNAAPAQAECYREEPQTSDNIDNKGNNPYPSRA